MVTYGGNRPTVSDDDVLTAQDFNDATRFWVTDELPDTGKDGDVVFVVGDPVGATAGGGKVLQVVRATDATRRSYNSPSGWVDANISVKITPTKDTSSIVVVWSFRGKPHPNNALVCSIQDASGNVLVGAEEMNFFNTSGGTSIYTPTITGYAEPNSTNEVTYKGMIRGVGDIFLENEKHTGQMFAYEIEDVVMSP